MSKKIFCKPLTPPWSHKKNQPNQSSRLAVYTQHIYVCLVNYIDIHQLSCFAGHPVRSVEEKKRPLSTLLVRTRSVLQYSYSGRYSPARCLALCSYHEAVCFLHRMERGVSTPSKQNCYRILFKTRVSNRNSVARNFCRIALNV